MCWWFRDIETIDELKKLAFEFYDEKILLPIRLHKKAMEL